MSEIQTARLSFEAEKCRRSAHYFIFDSGKLRTKDEHDSEVPLKAMPDESYLRCLLDLFLLSGKIIGPEQALYAIKYGFDGEFLAGVRESGMLMVEKSRQILGSWIVCCYLLWRAKYRAHQLMLVQSKREDDAANLVFAKEPTFARMSFLESNLPGHLRTFEFPKCASYGHLYAPNGSHVWAIPEGGEIVRSNTASVIVSDEAAFQPEFDKSYTAALPSIKGGGSYIGISSAENGEFESLVEASKTDELKSSSIPGLLYKITESGVPVVRVNYRADSKKRPGDPSGDLWLKQASSGYPGGTDSPRWRKEMEHDYGALGGTKLFPQWEQWAPMVRCRYFEPEGYKLYGSYDHGWRNPAAFHVHGINGDGYVVTLFELYDSHIPYQYTARIILGETVTVPVLGCCEHHRHPRTFVGNPFAKKEVWRKADPSIWAEDQPQSDGTNKSMADLFAKEGVHFQKGERGGDITVAEWLYSHYWKDVKNPLYRIAETCPKLLWEIGQQRHKDLSASVAMNRDQPEQLVDKDNHAWDSLKVFLLSFPPRPPVKREIKNPGTFNWWRNAQKRVQSGQAIGTFRI